MKRQYVKPESEIIKIGSLDNTMVDGMQVASKNTLSGGIESGQNDAKGNGFVLWEDDSSDEETDTWP